MADVDRDGPCPASSWAPDAVCQVGVTEPEVRHKRGCEREAFGRARSRGGRQPSQDLIVQLRPLGARRRSQHGSSWWLTRGESMRATDQRQDTIPRPESVQPRPLPPLGLSLALLLKNLGHEKNLCGAAEPTTTHIIMIAAISRKDTRIWGTKKSLGLLFRARCSRVMAPKQLRLQEVFFSLC